MYGLRPGGDTLQAAIGVVPLDPGWRRRLAQSLHLSPRASPIRLGWSEVPVVSGAVSGRALTLDLADLPAGRYRIELTLARRGDPPAVVSRDLELVASP
jgi:hypothetical protein